MYLLSASNDQEAGKPDYTCNGAHGKSHKNTDDNLLHNIPFILQPAKARTASLISASLNPGCLKLLIEEYSSTSCFIPGVRQSRG